MGFVTKLTFTVFFAGWIFLDAVQANDFAINCMKTAISVNENSPTNLTTVTANKNATFTIANATGGGNFFSIDKNGTLGISTLDVEMLKKSKFNVTVLANSSSNQQSQCTVTITVADINDNAPSFTQKEYKVNLQDHPAMGSSVINVTATDNDLTSPNNVVGRYSLAGTNNGDFAIDEVGRITVNATNISSAATPSYNLQVVAIDRGTPPLNGTAKLTICVGNCGSSGDTLHTWSIVSLVGSFLYVKLLHEK